MLRAIVHTIAFAGYVLVSIRAVTKALGLRGLESLVSFIFSVAAAVAENKTLQKKPHSLFMPLWNYTLKAI